MSLLTSKINSIEAEVLTLGDGKADVLFPTFTGTATFNGPAVLTQGATGLTPASVGLDKVQNIDAKAYTD